MPARTLSQKGTVIYIPKQLFAGDRSCVGAVFGAVSIARGPLAFLHHTDRTGCGKSRGFYAALLAEVKAAFLSDPLLQKRFKHSSELITSAHKSEPCPPPPPQRKYTSRG